MTQSVFICAVLDPLARCPTGLVDGHGRPAGKRFDVYRNNVIVGLKEALRSGFPAVKALVGDEFFDLMASEYIRRHPPTSPRLQLFGSTFADFITIFPPAASLSYLADVARLEQLLRRAYHAPDGAALSPHALERADLFLCRPVFAPAVAWFSSRYPVTQIHAAATGGPKPGSGAEDVLITRPDYDPVATALPTGSATVLAALADGGTFAQALDCAPPTIDLTGLMTALLRGKAVTVLEAPDDSIS